MDNIGAGILAVVLLVGVIVLAVYFGIHINDEEFRSPKTKKVLDDIQVIERKELATQSGAFISGAYLGETFTKKILVLKNLYTDKYFEYKADVDMFYKYNEGDIVHLEGYYHYEEIEEENENVEEEP